MDANLPERLKGALGVEVSVAADMPVVQIAPGQLLGAARTLRDRFAMDVLVDVTAVDWPDRTPRLEVVWHFFSSTTLERLRLKTRVPEDDPSVDSLTTLYGSAAFMERECHDMMGIRFRGNADLRPILLYEGFQGHPLRKDYEKEHEQPLVPYRDA